MHSGYLRRLLAKLRPFVIEVILSEQRFEIALIFEIV
jgi:hypothetical protein